jgi:hypothetical protein
MTELLPPVSDQKPLRRPLKTPARLARRLTLSKMLKASATLLEIDPERAVVATSMSLQVGKVVWLGLPVLPGEWVRAEVTGAKSVGSRTVCSLLFREHCPVGVLELATGERYRLTCDGSVHKSA